MISKVYGYILRRHYLWLIFGTVAFSFVWSYSLEAIFILFNLKETAGLSNPITDTMSGNKLFFAVVMLVPLIETFVFHYAGIYLLLLIFSAIPRLDKARKLKSLIIILITAILFAFTHNFSVQYFIDTLVMGFLLSTFYFISVVKRLYPFLIIFSIHSLRNLITYIINAYF